MISDEDVIRRRVRRRIRVMKEVGLAPDDLKVVDPLTGQAPTTWERVEELLIANYQGREGRPT